MFGVTTLAYIIATLVGVDARARNWHCDYQSNKRGRELAHFRLGRLVARDEKRGFRYNADRLTRTMKQLVLKLGHWDWVPRPHEVVQTWLLEPLPPDSGDNGKSSEPKARPERLCDVLMRERLRRLFTEKGLTHLQVSEAVDRNHGQVCTALQGRTSIPRHWIPKIAVLLEMGVEDLVSDTGWTGRDRTGTRQDRTETTRGKRSRKKSSPSTEGVNGASPEEAPDEDTGRKPRIVPESDKELGRRIDKLRRERHLSQSALADAVGSTQPLMSFALKGARPFPQQWLPALCELLGVDQTTLTAPVASPGEDGESAIGPAYPDVPTDSLAGNPEAPLFVPPSSPPPNAETSPTIQRPGDDSASTPPGPTTPDQSAPAPRAVTTPPDGQSRADATTQIGGMEVEAPDKAVACTPADRVQSLGQQAGERRQTASTLSPRGTLAESGLP